MKSAEAVLLVLAVVFFTAVGAFVLQHIAGGLWEQITGALR